MLAAALLTALAAGAGTLATYLYDDDSSLVTRVAYGVVSGLAVVSLVAFVLAHMIGIAAATIAASAFVILVAAGLSRTRARRRVADDVGQWISRVRARQSRPTAGSLAAVAYAAAVVAVLWLAFDRVIVGTPGGLATGYVNNLGDLPFHMHLSASFAYSSNFPPFDPTFAGSGFAYPYMADFVSAMYLAVGASMSEAFFLLNMSLGLALVAVIHRFTLVLTGDRLAAFIAPALVLLSGGLGWVDALGDARAAEDGLLAFLQALPQDYTINGEGTYRWGNAITTLLVTQRSLLFGLPLALMAFTLLWRLIHRAPATRDGPTASAATSSRSLRVRDFAAAVRERPEAVAAGVFTGLLPLIHAHSFVVVMGTAFVLGLVFRQWRDGRWLAWAAFVVVALAIALPEAWWSTRDSVANAGTFFGVEVGWDRGSHDPVTFWLLNTGLFIPLIVLALAAPSLRARLPRGLLVFSLPFAFWFVLPNVVKLAPWVWDNIKVLFYWYVGFVPLVALLIAWLLRDRRWQRLTGVGVLVMLVLAGSLDVWRVVSRQTEFGEFDRDGLAIAGHVLRATPPDSLVLHAATWNTPAFLTGRQSLLGYPGHMWSRGLDSAPREAEIRKIYGGAPEAPALLDRYGVDYMLVTPLEREIVNEEFVSQFTEVASAGEYRLLQIAP